MDQYSLSLPLTLSLSAFLSVRLFEVLSIALLFVRLSAWGKSTPITWYSRHSSFHDWAQGLKLGAETLAFDGSVLSPETG